MLESNPLKSKLLVGGLGVGAVVAYEQVTYSKLAVDPHATYVPKPMSLVVNTSQSSEAYELVTQKFKVQLFKFQ